MLCEFKGFIARSSLVKLSRYSALTNLGLNIIFNIDFDFVILGFYTLTKITLVSSISNWAIFIIYLLDCLKLTKWHVRNFELSLIDSLLLQLDFMLDEHRLLASLILKELVVNHLRDDLKSN